MIAMVNDQIEPAIKRAGKTDQKLVNAKHGSITQHNSASTDIRASLNKRAVALRKNIAAHNKLSISWKKAATSYKKAIKGYEKSVKSKTGTCCAKQQAAVPDVEYTPTYATCDIIKQTPKECYAAAEANLKKYILPKFQASTRNYASLTKSCKAKATKIPSFKKSLVSENKKCDKIQATSKAVELIVKSEMPSLLKEHKNAARKYNGIYKKVTSAYKSTLKTVKKQEADRKQEWASTQMIECLLTAYQAGGKFDSAAKSECEGKVSTTHLNMNYPTAPGALKWDLGKFEKLTDTASFRKTCDTDETVDEEADTTCVLSPANAKPVCKHHKTFKPTASPTKAPTRQPTRRPTRRPTRAPTRKKCTSSVTIYQHSKYNGSAKAFGRGSFNTLRGFKNDSVSSIRVPHGCKAYIYQHANYSGRRTTFPPGSYTMNAMKARGYKNDSASSIRVLNN